MDVPAPCPRLAVPPDHLLPEEVELIGAEQILLPGKCPAPNIRLAVPLEFLLPEEVKLLRAGRTLLLDESI